MQLSQKFVFILTGVLIFSLGIYETSLSQEKERSDTTRQEKTDTTGNDYKKEVDLDNVYMMVEKAPELVGGLKKLQQRVEYPESAREAGVEGRIYVQFVVTKKGEVVNAEVVRGVGAGCDEAALKAVYESEFKPARQRGEPVNSRYSLPVTCIGQGAGGESAEETEQDTTGDNG